VTYKKKNKNISLHFSEVALRNLVHVHAPVCSATNQYFHIVLVSLSPTKSGDNAIVLFVHLNLFVHLFVCARILVTQKVVEDCDKVFRHVHTGLA